MSSDTIGQIYDTQGESYANYADERFAWLYLERPAYDRYISDLYLPTTKVLDIGCGNGVVARHLVSRGINPHNIIGIDPSQGQIAQARRLTPDAHFEIASSDDFKFPAESMDLVVTNTVLHHLDNEQLEAMLARVYRVLKPGGSFFFVDVDPDHTLEGREPANVGRWTSVKTPWGTEVPFFNRNPHDLMDALDRHGFDMVAGWPLAVSDEGQIDPSEFARYSDRPSRMAARFKKVPELTRIYRFNDVRIPDLVETSEQAVMHDLANKYFKAWESQLIELVSDIFSENSFYDEKPARETPIFGLENILEYWRLNTFSRRNVSITHKIVGYGLDDSIWLEFRASFDVEGEHIDTVGALQLVVDVGNRKILRLTEHVIWAE